jgi:hypothetical protein
MHRFARYVPLLLVAALAACSAGGASGSSASGSGGAAGGSPGGAQAGGGGWIVVAQASGDADHQTTAPFALNGKEVRFVYTVEPNSTGPVPLLWKMRPEGAPLTAEERAGQSCIECDGEQIDELHIVPAGRYYVQVITSRPWTLKVEEQS